MKPILIFFFLLCWLNLICQITEQTQSIKPVNEAYSMKPRITIGVGSPELINISVALKYKKFQIAGMYGIFRTSGFLA
ncbi:MAG: hypothetical protein RLZZ546_1957, partial [Bacteroidota bacterium]